MTILYIWKILEPFPSCHFIYRTRSKFQFKYGLTSAAVITVDRSCENIHYYTDYYTLDLGGQKITYASWRDMHVEHLAKMHPWIGFPSLSRAFWLHLHMAFLILDSYLICLRCRKWIHVPYMGCLCVQTHLERSGILHHEFPYKNSNNSVRKLLQYGT